MSKKVKENRYKKLTDAQKQKYYGDERNRRRREKYAEDKEHRASILTRNRSAYYDRKGEEPKSLPDDSMIFGCLKEKRVRRKHKGAIIGEYNVIRRSDFIKAMQISTTTMVRWTKQSIFPEAELYEVVDEENGSVIRRIVYYTEEEAVALYNVYAEHVEKHGRYTQDHNETKNKLFAAVENVRKYWIK